MVIVIYDYGSIDFDENGHSNKVPVSLLKNTNNIYTKKNRKKKLSPLSIERLEKLRREAERREDGNIIRFGKYKGVHYEDLLHPDLAYYVSFLFRCPFKNEKINDFLNFFIRFHETDLFLDKKNI